MVQTIMLKKHKEVEFLCHEKKISMKDNYICTVKMYTLYDKCELKNN